jgi:tyrosine-specific transport protein
MIAAGTLAGTIIGAGVFALPYVVEKVGAITGLFYLCGAALVYYFLHRMYAAVVMKGDGAHDFAGLARAHLPRIPAFLAALTVVGELSFTLVVYLTLVPAFLSLVVPLPPLSYLLAFWVIGSLFIFARLSWQGLAELVGTLLIAAIIGIVLVAGDWIPFTTPLFRPLDLQTAFLPLGALLFAFMGRSAIIPLVREWRAKKDAFSLPRALAVGTFLPLPLYAIFAFGMLRLSPAVTPEALNSIGFLPPAVLVSLGLMGFVTLWTSYFMIGANLKDVLHLDLKIPSWFAAVFVLAFPLASYLLGFNAFFGALTFTGSIFLGLDGIFTVWMWRRAFPSHRFRVLAIPLALIFVAAIGYEVLSRFGAL